MKRYKGFTLIEVLVVLVIVSLLTSASIMGFKVFRNTIEFRDTVDQVLTDIKYTQQCAETSSRSCRIEFRPGENIYYVTKGSKMLRAGTVDKEIGFTGKEYFSFVPSGCTEVGGNGTLFVSGLGKTKKIIVSSMGRIRVE